MASQIQYRGGTTAEHAAFTGALREITVDTTKKTAVVHDGATPGGFPLAREHDATLTGTTTAEAINTSGNIGGGTTPSAWRSTVRVFEGPAGSLYSFSTSGLGLVQNAYLDGAGWKFRQSGAASSYEQIGGAHYWSSAASGAAGASASLNSTMMLDAAGNLLVGMSSGSNHVIAKNAAANVTILGIYSPTTTMATAYFNAVDVQGFNGAASALFLGKNNTTGRAVNAGGTINASGADYAEYMTKADGCGQIAKGQIIGVNVDGELTDKWAESVSFLIKSTDPSYVGGDVWGSEEVLGVSRPAVPVRRLDVLGEPDEEGGDPVVLEAGDTDEEWRAKLDDYAVRLAPFEAALEAARQKVDRIAFCGQVPVNVHGAVPGQYVVPVQDGEGISAVLVDEDDMTLKQYMKAVGIVQNVLPDGRANVRVKVA